MEQINLHIFVFTYTNFPFCVLPSITPTRYFDLSPHLLLLLFLYLHWCNGRLSIHLILLLYVYQNQPKVVESKILLVFSNCGQTQASARDMVIKYWLLRGVLELPPPPSFVCVCVGGGGPFFFLVSLPLSINAQHFCLILRPFHLSFVIFCGGFIDIMEYPFDVIRER